VDGIYCAGIVSVFSKQRVAVNETDIFVAAAAAGKAKVVDIGIKLP